MQVLVFSCSLNSSSRSRRLALEAVSALRTRNVETSLLDLRELNLPLCDGEGVYESPAVEELTDRIARASAILLAVPVYNYDINAAAKNLIELTGDAWREKPVGFLCAAGGKSSYMSVLGIANSLMLDFRCWIVPRFVYATSADVSAEAVTSQPVMDRILELTGAVVRQVRGLELTEPEHGIDEAEVS